MASVDVIVPCYNYARYLKDCVESVLTQSGVDVRVIVIDDASPDNTAEVASELAQADSRVTFVRHVANKGHIATYNEGIDWTARDYLLLLSADDYLLPGALARATAIMDRAPDIGFVFGNALTLQDNGSSEQNRPFGHDAGASGDRVMPGVEFIKYCEAVNIVPTPTAVVRTTLQKQVGGYRPELPHSGDLEMWLRLAGRAGVGFVDDYQAVYRVHQNNMSRSYMTEMMPDLLQRKLAIDYFFKHSGLAEKETEQLHDRLFGALGRDAVGRASAAFNEGRTELSGQLSDFALNVHPAIGKSLPWAKLSFKRSIGPKAWLALQSIKRSIGGTARNDA
jgi:glycosyltransferase involved in cell wall biosynthesis